MTVPRFEHGFTLGVKRSGGTDPFGARIPGSNHTVDDCAAAPAGSVEIVNGQSTVIDQDTIYGPYDADVMARDLVTVPAGQPIPAGEYQVDGTPARWKNPFTDDELGCVIRLTNPAG